MQADVPLGLAIFSLLFYYSVTAYHQLIKLYTSDAQDFHAVVSPVNQQAAATDLAVNRVLVGHLKRKETLRPLFQFKRCQSLLSYPS